MQLLLCIVGLSLETQDRRRQSADRAVDSCCLLDCYERWQDLHMADCGFSYSVELEWTFGDGEYQAYVTLKKPMIWEKI